MPANDLSLLIQAAQQAGDIARSFVGGDLGVEYKTHDDSPVTKADYAVNAALEEHLRSARPDYGWLSEESANSQDRLEREHVFIVDPIDGTRSFIAGEKTWAHSLAVARNGEITAAVVFLPMLDRLYTASAGGGAYVNGTPLRVGTRQDLTGAQVLATRPSMEDQHWPNGKPDIERHQRPSLAYRLSLVAQGRFDAMLTFRPSWEWDIAAGALILLEAGATATDKTGTPLRFNNAHPQTNGVLTANAVLHAALLDRLR